VKVFVAGATGVIGRRLLPMLVEGGHEVTAMTRSSEKAGAIRELGAEPVVCDVFDANRLRATIASSAPEVVVNELTDLPANVDPRKAAEQLAGNDRIREEGTRNLVDAALAAGARRMVAQSISFVYRFGGSALRTEAPFPWSRALRAVHALEDAVTKTDGLEGIVLRYGFFYGPGSSYASDAYWADQVRRRRFPIVGKGSGMFSFIHVDDAAAATVAAVEGGKAGIYNVVDDDPAPLREWVPAYAQALGAKKPMRLPKFVARMAAGAYTTQMATALPGVSNARAKAELGRASVKRSASASGTNTPCVRTTPLTARREPDALSPRDPRLVPSPGAPCATKLVLVMISTRGSGGQDVACLRSSSSPASRVITGSYPSSERAREMSIVHSCAESQ
jgi:2-alkyl-3-oxoalkanoate reductase